MRDQDALAHLAAEYARCVDRKDPDGVAACYAPNGVLRMVDRSAGDNVRGELIGREQIARTISRLRYKSPFHFIGQQQTAVNGDSATGETYCIAHHLSVPDDGGPTTDLVMYIRYLDQFTRLDEGWRFAVRELNIDWTENRTVE